jgi:hypothetical protein
MLSVLKGRADELTLEIRASSWRLLNEHAPGADFFALSEFGDSITRSMSEKNHL